jgi:hypothetical protein
MDNIIKIISVLIWPLSVLAILLIFRRPLISLTELVGSVEIPGGAKIVLDRTRVEKIIEEGAKKNTPAKQVADQIVKSAEDHLELRILRALFNEEDGRFIGNYVKYYPQAMNSLLSKGYIEKRDKKYVLTQSGTEATQKYLANLLTHQGALQTNHLADNSSDGN